MGLMRKALPGYLDLLNGYVPGLLFTVVADKRIVSLFGPQNRAAGEIALACHFPEGLRLMRRSEMNDVPVSPLEARHRDKDRRRS